VRRDGGISLSREIRCAGELKSRNGDPLRFNQTVPKCSPLCKEKKKKKESRQYFLCRPKPSRLSVVKKQQTKWDNPLELTYYNW
jgi:hypothetical protein